MKATDRIQKDVKEIADAVKSAMFFLTDTRKTDKEKVDFAIGALSNIMENPDTEKPDTE